MTQRIGTQPELMTGPTKGIEMAVAGVHGIRRYKPARSSDISARPRVAWPSDLVDRRVDVRRLDPRGMTNREIGQKPFFAARTSPHVASIYDGEPGAVKRAGRRLSQSSTASFLVSANRPFGRCAHHAPERRCGLERPLK